ncbi:hypothetical protein K1719_000348 [Acacia pycnantha]|nr:hypothetical protein K1719_000348 [Acacia pycnantha]
MLHRSSKKLKNDVSSCMEEEWPRLGGKVFKPWGGGLSFADKLRGISSVEIKTNVQVEDNPLSNDSISLSGPSMNEKSLNGNNGDIDPAVSSQAKDINSNHDVWRVVQRPCHQKQGPKEKLAGNSSLPVKGSRFGVLVDEGEGQVDVVVVAQSDEPVVGERENGVGLLEMSRSINMKQVTSGFDNKKEKRSRDISLSDVGGKERTRESYLCINNGGGKTENVVAIESTENRESIENLGAIKDIVNDPLDTVFWALDSPSNPLIDPGYAVLSVRPSGRFWAGSAQEDSDCIMVGETPVEEMGAPVGPGACGRNLSQNIRLLERPHHFSLIILAETKCENDCRLKHLGSLGFDGISFIPSVGRSGGLAAIWKTNLLDVSTIVEDRQFLHLRCSIRGKPVFFLTVVYANPNYVLKQTLWTELEKLAFASSEPWAALGDFNDIISQAERSGGAGGDESRFNLFAERIQRCRLSDMGSVGPKFTWKGLRLLGGSSP